MSHELIRDEFTEADWDEVQSYRCGDLYYQKEVSDWLKGRKEVEETALSDMNHPENPTRVWLYRTEYETLVGVGSLVRSEWRWTENKDPWVPVMLIPWCGLHVDFHRDPYEPKELRYANQIMNDLIGEAAEEREKFPVLGLFVQQENEPAIKLYNRFKFTSEGLGTFTVKKTGITYQKMALILHRENLLAIRAQKKMKRG